MSERAIPERRESAPTSLPVSEVRQDDIYWTPHPFVWEVGSRPSGDENGPFNDYFLTWRPGLRGELIYPDDGEEVADGMGHQILTVVSVHKPGKFPTRVFYTRRWRDPQGHEFGKGGLRIKTLAAFKVLARGWRHPFRVVDGVEFLKHDASVRAELAKQRGTCAEAA